MNKEIEEPNDPNMVEEPNDPNMVEEPDKDEQFNICKTFANQILVDYIVSELTDVKKSSNSKLQKKRINKLIKKIKDEVEYCLDIGALEFKNPNKPDDIINCRLKVSGRDYKINFSEFFDQDEMPNILNNCRILPTSTLVTFKQFRDVYYPVIFEDVKDILCPDEETLELKFDDYGRFFFSDNSRKCISQIFYK